MLLQSQIVTPEAVRVIIANNSIMATGCLIKRYKYWLQLLTSVENEASCQKLSLCFYDLETHSVEETMGHAGKKWYF